MWQALYPAGSTRHSAVCVCMYMCVSMELYVCVCTCMYVYVCKYGAVCVCMYRRTLFKCESLIIANCEFFPQSHLKQRNK